MITVRKFISRRRRNWVAEFVQGTFWLGKIPEGPYIVIYTEDQNGELKVLNYGTVFITAREITTSKHYMPACFLKKLAGKHVRREIIPHTSWLETAHPLGP